MEVPCKEEENTEMKPEKASSSGGRQKGGLVTMPFIIANESFEKVASYGLLPNMILYLIQDYHMGVAQGSNVLFYWSAATNFLPLVGAFLSDSFLGRFLTICLGSVFSLLGMIFLWSTTVIPKARPPACNIQVPQSCKSPTPAQYSLLFSAFAIMSVGAGGVRPCSLAFGADQVDRKENPNRERVLESFFGWYYATAVMAVLIAFTAIVYIQDHFGWRVGFGVPVILMFFSALLFFIASPLYHKIKVERSLFTSFCQVISAAHKNRKLPIPSSTSGAWYHQKDSQVTMPTETLRCLNRACIIRNPEEMSKEGAVIDPWRLCTIEQVEELKSLIRVIPLWSSSIMMSVNMSQSSFPVLQAKTMDRHVTSNFEIPAASFGFFTIVTIMIWIALYDRVILPLLSKIRGKPVHISVKVRMGVGLAFSILGMAVSGIVEQIRRKKAIEEGFLNNSQAVIHMSAMWLVPQHVLNGLAEAFNAIGQTEFYYSEFPKSMSSIASSLFGLGMAVANLLASLILSTVNDLTKGEDKESWITTNINKGHYEKYYWLLAIMSSVNLLYYVVCSWAYGPLVDKRGKGDRIKDSGEEEKASNT